MITLYGINNCDTVKKALKWLTAQGINYQFYDFKKQPLTEELLISFVEKSSWEKLLNKRSTTFRNLPDTIKNNLSDDVIFKAVIEQPTLLKRPLLVIKNTLTLGFKTDNYQALFNLSEV